MSNFDFRFNHLSDKNIYVPLMHKVIDISKRSNFTTGDRFATVWSKIFASWTTDEVKKCGIEAFWMGMCVCEREREKGIVVITNDEKKYLFQSQL